MVSPYRAMNFVCRQRWQGKPHNRACGALEMHPYSPAGTSPKGKRVTGFSFALRLPTNQVPLSPQRGKFALRLPSRPYSHSERQRRISVRGAVEPNAIKYQSAGRLLFGSQTIISCHFGLPRRTPPRHFVALSAPLGSVSPQGGRRTLRDWLPYPPVILGGSKESWYAGHLRQSALHTGR